jgi:hypothetical protein
VQLENEEELLTWSRFDDAAPSHPKARLAGNEAWGLWAAAIMYCNRYLTDGVVSLRALSRECLPEPISEAKAKKLASRLCDAKMRADGKGLFSEVDGGYLINDFLIWNPSKADVESKREADRERKRNPKGLRSDSNRIPDGIPADSGWIPNGFHEDSESASRVRVPAPAGARIPALPSPPAQPGEEDPPTPLVESIVAPVPANGRRKTDNFLASMTGKLNRDRPDVISLFDDWKALHGQPEAKLCVGIWNADADTLAEAIDAYTLEVCELVLRWSPNDGMVSGRDDERKLEHKSIGYIFGNQNAFMRILAAARKAEPTNHVSVREKMERAAGR